MLMRKNITSITCRAAFSDGVDWSAILIDLWEAPGWLMSELGPGCVKTCASRECAELFSPLSPFDSDCQCCSFPIQRNRDKISTSKFNVGVFTQPGSDSDLGARSREVRFSRHPTS